jgi:cell division protein FtsI/penicillin-binding protein 2
MKERYPELRWRVIAVVLGIAFAAVFLRLGWVQVVRDGYWKGQAEVSSTDVRPVLARRGKILDRRGQVLAGTEIYANVGVARPHLWLKTDYPARVAPLLGLTERELRRKLDGQTGHTIVARDMLLDAVTRNELTTTPNVSVDQRLRRLRPHGDLARQILGIVSNSRKGVSGLEKIHEEVLAGTAGEVLVRQDAYEGIRSRRYRVKPVDGADIVTTLDLRIQSILEGELRHALKKSEAVAAQGIVLHVQSGEVLALAQAPLNTPSADCVNEGDAWRVMAATDEFEPGSVFKLFSLATLLSESVLDTSTVYDGEGEPGDWRAYHRFPNGRTIRDVHPVGRVSMRHAFVTSSNIIFAKAVEERLKTVELHEAIRRFGFLEKPGSGFPAETDGTLLRREDWSSYMMPSLSMGQSIGMNFLQLATASAALFGDGTLRSPLFVREIRPQDAQPQRLEAVVRRRNVVSKSVIARMRSVARGVVHEEYGTAENARVEGLSIAGKTGTAQVSTGTGYLKGIYSPSFVGAVPAEDPRLIVAIVLHGAPGEETYGGNTAAPCFSKVVQGIAARTEWLEGAFEVVTIDRSETISAPSLTGLSVDEVREMAANGDWQVDFADLPGHARAVSQMPRAGAPMMPNSRVQVAWSGGRR